MRVVAALGGNAFVRAGEALTVEGERRFAREALAALAPFLAPAMQLLVVHGNGPQVGHQLDRAERARDTAYPLPLDVCVAQTQGELGYILAQALGALLAERGISRTVVALVTQVEIDLGDDAFRRPAKPKIEAAIRFVARGERRAIVCDPPSLAAALRGEAGTIVQA